MTTAFPQLKLKTLVNFPTAAVGRNGIAVVTTSGSYFIDIDYSKFSTAPAMPAGSYILTYNPITQAYVLAVPAGASPSDNIPLMNGTGAAGVSGLYSRYDHVHPSDSSRAPLVSPAFTGTPTAVTATFGTNTTQLATTAFVQAAITGGAAVPGIPQNSQSANYTTVLADNGRHIFHPSTDTTARTWTIDSNANVPQPIGAVITFVNQNGAGVITIAITADTMRLAGPGTTGSRTLAANGVCTALKVTATEWIVSGTGLT